MTNPNANEGVRLFFHNQLKKTKKHFFRLEKDIFLELLSHFITKKMSVDFVNALRRCNRLSFKFKGYNIVDNRFGKNQVQRRET